MSQPRREFITWLYIFHIYILIHSRHFQNGVLERYKMHWNIIIELITTFCIQPSDLHKNACFCINVNPGSALCISSPILLWCMMSPVPCALLVKLAYGAAYQVWSRAVQTHYCQGFSYRLILFWACNVLFDEDQYQAGSTDFFTMSEEHASLMPYIRDSGYIVWGWKGSLPFQTIFISRHLWPILLIWFNFNPSMDM